MNCTTMLQKAMAVACMILAIASCKKDKDPVIIIPPSSGSTLQLDGGTGGAAAINAVFVDFSADKQTPVLRDSWDLGFYCGSDFKVTINLTNGAAAVAVNKTDINTVTAADFDRDTLRVGLDGMSVVGSFAVIDDTREPNILNKTVIAAVSANDADNKVYILNRKGGDASAADANLYKIRILRKGNGYTLQYAKLAETTFKTLEIDKETDFNFRFASLVSGTIVNVEPAKANWDLVWSWSMYYTGPFPYAFSDFVAINNIGGAAAFERVYASDEAAADAYAKFNKDSAAQYTFSSRRDAIGTTWRRTAAPGATLPAGVYKTKFYVVRDGSGNLYKLKFLSFTSEDGGTRGKPQIEYTLIH
ncbi:HmuY family protein [Niabella aurantiaca]|uniref:HmuY family protein n=1 Tax=Niabella aurantiaca TaxID=379900 RepID=UPI00039FBB99|nr:HmuY family protein [Niabella aurantiaca]